MKKFVKKGLITALVSAMLITTVYAGSMLAGAKNDNKTTTKDLFERYSATYGSNLVYGTELLVWAGDKDFDPSKDFTPTASLGKGDKVEFVEGKIDLTPGATSPVIYKISCEDGDVFYKMYEVTAVSKRTSATVHSKSRDKIVWGVEKSEGYGGYTPADYTASDTLYTSEKELTIKKGSTYNPKYSFVNYDPSKFVVDYENSNLDTSKEGTYQVIYDVSPISDARSSWRQVYNINVVNEDSENKGTKVVADDTAIHATVLDNKGNTSEVYMGNEYNLSTSVKKITVQSPSRNEKAYADIKVFKDGKEVNKDEIVTSQENNEEGYIISLKNTEGYEIRLTNQKYLDKKISVGKNYVVGGWQKPTGVEIDSAPKEKEEKGISSFIMGFAKPVNVFAKPSGTLVATKSAKGAIKSVTAARYWSGRSNCIDGVHINFSGGKLDNVIEDLIEPKGLIVVDDDDVPGSVYTVCCEEGKWGYGSLSLSYANATLEVYKSGKTYNLYIATSYYNNDKRYQRLGGGSTVSLEMRSCAMKVTKGSNVVNGVVKGAVFGVYTNKGCTDLKFKLKPTKSNGVARATKAQNATLTAGKSYWVKEITAPTGTYKNGSAKKFVAVANKTVNVSIDNDAWENSIHVTKVRRGDNATLEGAYFKVLEWNKDSEEYGNPSQDAAKGPETTSIDGKTVSNLFKTNSSGKFTISKLKYTKKNLGKFKVIEVKAPTNYVGNASKTFTITETHNLREDSDGETWKPDNIPKPANGWITINKKVKENSDGSGRDYSNEHDLTAIFNIYSDAEYNHLVDTIITNRKGYGKSRELTLDEINRKSDFWIKEIECDEGMDPAFANGIKVTVKDGETIETESKGVGRQIPWYLSLEVYKKDISGTKNLNGALFQFYEWNGSDYKPIGNPVETVNGVAKVGLGSKNYTHEIRWKESNQGKFAVQEVKAPNEYLIDNPFKEFTTLDYSNRNGSVSFEFRNTQYGYLSIRKYVVNKTGTIMSGFDLSSAFLGISYDLRYYDTSTNKVGDVVPGFSNIKLNSSGYFKSSALRPGFYYLTEKSLNNNIFVNPKASIKLEIKGGLATYVDGEKGVKFTTKANWENNTGWDGSDWSNSIFK